MCLLNCHCSIFVVVITLFPFQLFFDDSARNLQTATCMGLRTMAVSIHCGKDDYIAMFLCKFFCRLLGLQIVNFHLAVNV